MGTRFRVLKHGKPIEGPDPEEAGHDMTTIIITA